MFYGNAISNFVDIIGSHAFFEPCNINYNSIYQWLGQF